MQFFNPDYETYRTARDTALLKSGKMFENEALSMSREEYIDKIYSQATKILDRPMPPQMIAEPSSVFREKDRFSQKTHITAYPSMYQMVKLGNVYIANIRYSLLEKRQNWTSAIVGKVGSGKSMGALFLAKLIDPTFNVDRICFTAQDYLQMVKVIKPGQMVVWDEIGAGLGSREFATKVNRNVGKVFQTQRYKQFGCLVTLPQLNLLDKQPRELLHSIISMKKILKSYNVSLARIYENKIDPIKQNVRQVLPKIRIGNTIYKIRDFAFKIPPKGMVEEYEKRKDSFFQNNILSRALEDHMSEEEKVFDAYRKDSEDKAMMQGALDRVRKEPFLFGKKKEGAWVFEINRICAVMDIPKEIAMKVKYKAEFIETQQV